MFDVYDKNENFSLMKLLKILVLSLILLLIVSMVIWRKLNSRQYIMQSQNTLKYALQLAGENRTELEKVLEHYRGDSLKYKAVIFLIENMPYYFSERWGCIRKGRPDTVFSLKSYRSTTEALHAMDSLQIKFTLVRGTPDVKEVKADFLINHIDRVFGLWRKRWAKHLSFDEFCEYLLPYRVDLEELNDFSEYFKSRCRDFYASIQEDTSSFDVVKKADEYFSRMLGWCAPMTLYPGCFTAGQMIKSEMGNCNQLSNFGTQLYRTLGMGVANDFVTAWGNHDAGHSWIVVQLPDKNLPFVPCDIKPGDFYFGNRPPKIYRKTYAQQNPELLAYKYRSQKVPPELDLSHCVDVTDYYYKTIDLTIPLSTEHPKDNNCTFLCVFNNNRWFPIDWGKITADGKRSSVENINDSLLYCAMYFDGVRLKPASVPFFPNAEGVQYFIPNRGNTCSFTYKVGAKTKKSDYSLFIWDDGWKKVATETIRTTDGDYFLEFHDIPSGALYKIDDNSRPFWLVKGKLVERGISGPYHVAQFPRKRGRQFNR